MLNIAAYRAFLDSFNKKLPNQQHSILKFIEFKLENELARLDQLAQADQGMVLDEEEHKQDDGDILAIVGESFSAERAADFSRDLGLGQAHQNANDDDLEQCERCDEEVTDDSVDTVKDEIDHPSTHAEEP